MPQAASPTHIGRQSRPNQREKSRYCEISGDVDLSRLRHFLYRSDTKYTVL